MSAEQMLAFLLFALAASVTPGPSNLVLTAIGANAGILKGLPSLFGATAGMAFMMFTVSFGLGSFVLANPFMLKILNWCGEAFLLWLSWKIATVNRIESSSAVKPVGFIGMAVFQWVNPKAWLVSASAAGTFLSAEAGSPFLQSALFGGIFFLASSPCCFLWLASGATVKRVLDSPRRLRIFNISMGVLLALSIVLIIW